MTHEYTMSGKKKTIVKVTQDQDDMKIIPINRKPANKNIISNARSKLSVIIDLLDINDSDEKTLRCNTIVALKHLRELYGEL
jgi:hypothetical protein